LQWDPMALDRALREALRQIRVLFASGQSSALDTDVNGNTLLHVSPYHEILRVSFHFESFINFRKELVQLAIKVEETSETTKALFRTLIMYILSAGAVKDAEARVPPTTPYSSFSPCLAQIAYYF